MERAVPLRGWLPWLPCLLRLLVAGCAGLAGAQEQLTCVSCVEGTFLGEAGCETCPANSFTLPGVNGSSIADCECVAGYTNASSLVCGPCGADTFKTALGNFSCEGCPENTQTLGTGATAVAQCVCDPGFARDANSGECAACAAGTFKGSPGDDACGECDAGGYCAIGSVSPTACPANSTSAAGATNVRDCQCAAGFFAVFGVDGEGSETLACVPCPAGTFNPADSEETVNAAQCVLCPTDTYFDGTGAAAQDECVPCPTHASAPAGSGGATACLCALGYAGAPGEECVACVPGFFRSDPSEYICEACPAGSYHDVDVYANTNVESCLSCPADTASAAGSGSASACVCDAGHYAADAASRELWSAAWQCEPCVGGSFSTAANASACELCVAGKYSAATGASSPDTCLLCAEGHFAIDAGSVVCEPCAPGTWQDAAGADATGDPAAVLAVRAAECLACPQFSGHGLNGSVSVDDCVCAGGFFKDVSAADYESGDVFECTVCTAGSACPGNNSVVPCAVNHYAEAGASVCVSCPANSEGVVGVGLLSASQCQCVSGYEGTFGQHCVACPAGEFQGADYTYDSVDADLRTEVSDALQANGFESLTAFAVTCEACAEGTFSNAPAQSVCLTCAANASAPAGSDASTDCACEAGFYGPDGGPCALCPTGSFCAGGLGHPQTCRLHSTSAAGAVSEAECACVPGFFSTAADSPCQKCAAGGYCPGGVVVQACAANSTSPAGAAAASACTCAPGHWRGCTPVEGGGAVDANNAPCEIDFLLPCVECGEDVVCLNNTVLHCPEHSLAPAGSSHSEDCVCEGGYFNHFLVFH